MFFANCLSLLPYFSIVSSASPKFLRLSVTFNVSSKYGWAGVKVDRAGFEPAASALRTRRSYRTDLPAHFWKNTVMRAFRAFGGSASELFGHIWCLIVNVCCKPIEG